MREEKRVKRWVTRPLTTEDLVAVEEIEKPADQAEEHLETVAAAIEEGTGIPQEDFSGVAQALEPATEGTEAPAAVPEEGK